MKHVNLISLCSEAAMRGQVSARSVGPYDPEEQNADSAVSGRHAGPASGVS